MAIDPWLPRYAPKKKTSIVQNIMACPYYRKVDHNANCSCSSDSFISSCSINSDSKVWPSETQGIIMAARQPAMLAAGHSVLPLSFRSLFFFSPADIRGRLADRHQTLPDVRWWPGFIKFGRELWSPLPSEMWRPKNFKILARLRTTSRLDHLRNATRHRQSENGFANYGHSHTCKLNLAYFGPQTAKK